MEEKDLKSAGGVAPSEPQPFFQRLQPAPKSHLERLKGLDSRLRSNDKNERFLTFYEAVEPDWVRSLN